MTFSQIFDMVFDSFLIAVVSVVIVMFCIYLYKRHKQQTFQHPYRITILLLYVFMLINITVFRGGLFQNEEHFVNLIPFDELVSVSFYQASVLGKKEALIILAYNVVGNIAWFVPFGILLPMYFDKIKWKQMMLYAFLFSLSIEVLQYIFYTGVSDVDDIIFNVVGALCGDGLYRFVNNKRRISCQ